MPSRYDVLAHRLVKLWASENCESEEDLMLNSLSALVRERLGEFVPATHNEPNEEVIKAIAFAIVKALADEPALHVVAERYISSIGSTRDVCLASPPDLTMTQTGPQKEPDHQMAVVLRGQEIVEQGDIRFGRPPQSSREKGRLPLLRSLEDRRCTLLFVAANSADHGILRIDEEIRQISGVILRSPLRGFFNFRQEFAPRIRELQDALFRNRPRILHISSHGSVTSELLFSESSQNSRPIPAEPLADLLSLFSETIECVLLNACHTFQLAQMITKTIGCAIGMEGRISDDAAICFSSAFYEAMGNSKDVGAAFSLACAQVGVEHPTERHTPHLFASLVSPSDLMLLR